jgi:3-hydroxy-3-methylglutaryl CoA synthase
MQTALASITACGAHVPRLRLHRKTIADQIAWANPAASAQAQGTRAICNWDEDSITLAVDAARACALGALPQIDALTLASTTLPFTDRSNAALVAAALDLPEALDTLDAGGSMRAGSGALADAAQRAGRVTLVIGADARRARAGSSAELSYGDAAAALLVGPPRDNSNADVLAVERLAANFVDHYRSANSDFDYSLEERWVRDSGFLEFAPRAIARVLQRAQLVASDVAHFAMPGPANLTQRVARAAGLTRASITNNLHADVGDSGAAHPLLMLVAALEQAAAGEVIVLGAFGQGFDALVLRAGARRLAQRPLTQAIERGADEPSYVRYLSHANLLDVDFGMRAERDHRTAHTVAWRKNRAVSAFVGGRCQTCGTVQYPPSRVCVNPDCRATDTQESHPLAETRGKVKTFTEDWQAYSPRPPYVYGNVEFAAGGNLLMEITDAGAGEIAVGDAVRFVFRVKDYDRARGFRRYFWKAAKA